MDIDSRAPQEPTPKSGQPGADIIISGVTWPKLLSIIGASLMALAGIIWVLLSIVFADITEKIDSRYTN
jgi:hypothetical protein